MDGRESVKKETDSVTEPSRFDWAWRFVSEPSARWGVVQIIMWGFLAGGIWALWFRFGQAIEVLRQIQRQGG